MYCLPVLKHERHRQALLKAVASGSPKFFLGTDSAPHLRTTKEASCGERARTRSDPGCPVY
jgi:dihydroorotase